MGDNIFKLLDNTSKNTNDFDMQLGIGNSIVEHMEPSEVDKCPEEDNYNTIDYDFSNSLEIKHPVIPSELEE